MSLARSSLLGVNGTESHFNGAAAELVVVVESTGAAVVAAAEEVVVVAASSESSSSPHPARSSIPAAINAHKSEIRAFSTTGCYPATDAGSDHLARGRRR